jgi:alpha-D-xyloside xylohydrolase
MHTVGSQHFYDKRVVSLFILLYHMRTNGGFMVKVYQYDLNKDIETLSVDLVSENQLPIIIESMEIKDTHCSLKLTHTYQSIFGLGERFNQVNQKGKEVEIEIIEKFCNQGELSYCPIPFFFTDNKFGMFIDTFTVTNFNFENENKIDSQGLLPHIYFFGGSPSEIISEYARLTGMPLVTPKWSFGPWMSANRWNTEEEVDRQIDLLEEYKIPHSVMVLEAWSDEATFYRFNEHGEWQDPSSMIERLREKGIHLILWQIPVLKRMDNGEHHPVLDQDWKYAIEHDLCIKNTDGTPYRIPENHWFSGSLLPDFTNPKAVEWWFSKRQYLLDMGVDGFKTDGGEFVLTDQVIASNGCTGLEMRNQYALSYVKAYTEFIGKDRVLFSRAGYKGQQNYPMQWAGDQMSTWEEFRHVMVAGISMGLSGVPYWGFDIGGFAGDMPTKELYERATQASVFTPVMQWHSEPMGGQFAELYPTTKGINDRSPWNISLLYGDDSLIGRLRYHFNLRMNLLPYIYNEALFSGNTGLPMMKHLVLEYPDDKNVYDVEDAYMLGDILVAPILEEGTKGRVVYLPEGTWTSLWDMEVDCLYTEGQMDYIPQINIKGNRLVGGHSYLIQCARDRIPAFIRDGACIVFNLDDTLKLGSYVGNELSKYENLCFYMTGSEGTYHFVDDQGNDIMATWKDGHHEICHHVGDVKVTIIKNV